MKRAVVDQPGFKIFFLGSVLSLMLGLSIRAQITPRKIKSKIDQAILRLQTDISIDFKSIEIKLSDWGWPQPYLEVHDIRLSPIKSICDESQIFIDTLSFPLSWNLIFESKKVIQSLRINLLEIRFSEIKKCFSTDTADSEAALNKALVQVFSASTAGQLQSLKIDRIKILSKSNYKVPLYLQSAVFDFSYADQVLSKLDLKAQLSSHHSNLNNIFKLRSDLNLNIQRRTASEIQIEGVLAGQIIDRPYNLKFEYVNEKNIFSFKLDFEKVATKMLLKFLDFQQDSFSNYFSTTDQNYLLTLKGAGEYNLTSNAMSELKISNLRLETNQSVITSLNTVFEDVAPLKIKFGSEFSIQNYDLKTYLNQNIKDDVFLKNMTQFGRFSGQIKFSADNAFHATGQVVDLDFNLNFKNKPWLQKINSIDVDMTENLQQQELSVSNFMINGQKIRGQLNYMQSHHDGKKYNLTLSGQFLAPDMIAESTGQEQSVVLDLTLNKNLNDQIKLTAQTANLKFQNIDFKNFKMITHGTASKFEQLGMSADQLGWISNVSEAAAKDSLVSVFDKIYEKQKNNKNISDEENENKILKNIELSSHFFSDDLHVDIMNKNRKMDPVKATFNFNNNIFNLGYAEVVKD